MKGLSLRFATGWLLVSAFVLLTQVSGIAADPSGSVPSPMSIGSRDFPATGPSDISLNARRHGEIGQIREELQCTIDCPPGATAENEPICYDEYVDATNGGCGAIPPVFGSISLGETICGTGGTFLLQGGEMRDTDWFMFTLADPETATVTGCAEFPLLLMIIQMGPSGDECEGFSVLGYASGAECDTLTVSVSANAGLACVWVGSTAFSGYPCGVEYWITLTTEATGYEYLPGDANMFAGAWPPQAIGSDVTYIVNYLRNSPAAQPCLLDDVWASGDVNGSCDISGSDVIRFVNFLRGTIGLTWCPDHDPAWPTPQDVPAEQPPGWPGCDSMLGAKSR